MKNIFLIIVLAIGLMSFTSSSKVDICKIQKETISNSKLTTSVFEYEEDGKWVRRRTCYYRGGHLWYCSPWEYVYILDEVEL